MLKVVKLHPDDSAKKMSNDLVIKRLEESLDIAKKGDLINCVILMLDNEGNIYDCWATPNSPYTILGGLESLKTEFSNANIQKRSER